MEISIILAVDNQYGIGKNNTLPWCFPRDLERFQSKTTGHVIVMGHNTFKSLPRLLPNRHHLVLTRQHLVSENSQLEYFNDWDMIITRCLELSVNKKIFFIGGKEIFEKGLTMNCKKIYLTRIEHDYNCDVHIDISSNLKQYNLVKSSRPYEEAGIKYRFETYQRSEHQEYQYLYLLKQLIYQGECRQTRNSITYSEFGKTLEFDIRHSFPLLTTKKMATKAIVEELLWFLRGQTDAKILDKKGVKIWNGNSSREALNHLGLGYYEDGDCGPVYGFQWRHFGAEYRGCRNDYIGQGIDQIGHVLYQLRHDRTSRRILFSGWNPKDISKMCLPPCHVLYQFYVDKDEYLHCQMYQRSMDVFLGAPFNIASTALLVYILAHYTGLKPGSIRMCIGDVHIYDSHIESVKQQLLRQPLEWCNLQLENMPEKLEDVEIDNIKFVNYKSHDTIRAVMIV